MTVQDQAAPPAPTPPAPYDEYLLEAYRQAGDNARMYAASRFSNLTSFLTYMGLLTAASAFLLTNREKHPELQWGVVAVAVFGCALALLFWAMEVRHHHWWHFYEMRVVRRLEQDMGCGQYLEVAPDGTSRAFVSAGRRRLGATAATYGIYLSSCCFFVAMGVLSLL